MTKYTKEDFEYLQEQVQRADLREEAMEYAMDTYQITTKQISDSLIEIQKELKEAFKLLDLNP